MDHHNVELQTECGNRRQPDLDDADSEFESVTLVSDWLLLNRVYRVFTFTPTSTSQDLVNRRNVKPSIASLI